MRTTNTFPDLSQSVAGAFSDSDTGIKTGVMLDGMHVIFDKKVSASPVNLDYKKNRKVLGKKN